MFRKIVVLTGAGISAESGIKTFRDAGGLWENYRIEDVATPEGYARNPELVLNFYNERRRHLLGGTIRPNPGHLALAELEKNFPGGFLLVTQNVDNLHEQAGSRNVLHMHGELLKVRCARSGKVFPAEEDVHTEDRCPCCNLAGALRPHVVWFGEIPLEMNRIFEALSRCDLFISVGTSGVVYPAAGFVQVAREAGAHTVELNLEPSAVQSLFAEKIYGPASRAVPEYVQKFFANKHHVADETSEKA